MRKEAAAAGKSRYFTGLPCKHGHINWRYVSTGGCVECLNPRLSGATVPLTLKIPRDATAAEIAALAPILQNFADALLDGIRRGYAPIAGVQVPAGDVVAVRNVADGRDYFLVGG